MNSEMEKSDDSFVLGYVLGKHSNENNSNNNDNNNDDEEWTFPESWGDIPEPSRNQYIILLEVPQNRVNSPSLGIAMINSNSFTIDWGDGYVDENVPPYQYQYAHFYSSAGLYVIKITSSEFENVSVNIHDNFRNSTYRVSGDIFPVKDTERQLNGDTLIGNIRAIKNGAGIYGYNSISSGNGFTGIVYFKFCGDSILTIPFSPVMFSGCQSLCRIDSDIFPSETNIKFQCYNCYSLKSVDFTKNFTTLDGNVYFQNCYGLKIIDLSSIVDISYDSTFSNCPNLKEINMPVLETTTYNFSGLTGLKKFYAPKLTELPANCFYNCYNLEEIYTPMLAEVPANALQNCYSLKKFTYAEGCNFNGNTFETCLSLYPKPK